MAAGLTIWKHQPGGRLTEDPSCCVGPGHSLPPFSAQITNAFPASGHRRSPERFRQGYDQSAALRSYNGRTDVRTLNVSRARHPPWPL